VKKGHTVRVSGEAEAKTAPTAKPEAKPELTPVVRTPDPYEEWGVTGIGYLRNRAKGEIVVHLLNGEIMPGKLVGMDRWNLVLDTGGKQHLVPKHAVLYVEDGGT